MNIKKIVFLSICVLAIIGSTFLLNTNKKTSNFDDTKNNLENAKQTPANIFESPIYIRKIIGEPATNYKIYTDLKCVDFIYPFDISKINEDESPMANVGASESISFFKLYGDEQIFIVVSCYYKDETIDDPLFTHYYEENTKQVLAALLIDKNFFIDKLVVDSLKAGDDFVSYIECCETYDKMSKYYVYEYISPGDPEIRAHIRYGEDFKEQFDLYIAEFEKTIKRK